jgi:hypothetical protein
LGGRCIHASACKLFPRFKKESTLHVWRRHYCNGRYKQCERYRRISQGRDVPPDMLPNGKPLSHAADSR